MRITRRHFVAAAASAAVFPSPRASAQAAWGQTLAQARGKPVFFNAWGGDERTNAFIEWTAIRLRAEFGIELRHVRLRDTAEAVQRVIAEKSAGRDAGGAVDLVWINGPNFVAMKERGLLFGPFAQELPNFRYVDTVGKPSTIVDFTVPVEGYAAPWRMAQIVYVYDAARLANPPRSIPALRDWALANPGRTTHPAVRNFLGATFLKQALFELAPDSAVLQREAGGEYEASVAPLWRWYDALRPALWRQGRQFPDSGPAQRQLLNDGEIDLMVSFNPAEAAVSIANELLPKTARVYTMAAGTIGNTSFVAIPYNAANRAAAMVASDFLMGPEAQARMSDPRQLGNPSVLDIAKLPEEARRFFAAVPPIAGMPTQAELGRVLPEPHPSWMTRIAADWERRYTG
ncbi:MAG: ABC transporter substrate-binding protein [Magnetospirillum sp.]|nr:ABC transporter substrate-binding protein [Magnetospirillum sp.]